MKKSDLKNNEPVAQKKGFVRQIGGQTKPAPFPGVAGTLLLVHTAAYLALFLLGPHLTGRIGGQPLYAWLNRTLIVQGIFIFLPTVLILLITRIPARMVVGTSAAPGSFWLALFIGVPAAVVFQGLNNLLLYLLLKSGIHLPVGTDTSFLSITSLLERPPLVLAAILIVATIIPALVEELFFRGVLLSSLTSRGSFRAALIWQAIAFALFHADPLFILPPFLSGLLLAFIREKCGQLWPAILAHFSLNFSLIALNPLLPRFTRAILLEDSQHTASLLYASLIAASIAAVGLVPLLALLANLRPQRKTGKLIIFPGDWKFALATVLQIVTLILVLKSA